jgi:hypothetical protein
VSVPFRERAGVIVVRVWIEGDAVTGLRARITASDLSSGGAAREETVAVAASIEEIVSEVGRWLEAFVAG